MYRFPIVISLYQRREALQRLYVFGSIIIC